MEFKVPEPETLKLEYQSSQDSLEVIHKMFFPNPKSIEEYEEDYKHGKSVSLYEERYNELKAKYKLEAEQKAMAKISSVIDPELEKTAEKYNIYFRTQMLISDLTNFYLATEYQDLKEIDQLLQTAHQHQKFSTKVDKILNTITKTGNYYLIVTNNTNKYSTIPHYGYKQAILGAITFLRLKGYKFSEHVCQDSIDTRLFLTLEC